MSRYDKYDPKAGGFRLNLASAFTADGTSGNETDTIHLVNLNGNGQAVLGANGTGTTPVGVAVVNRAVPAGKPIDVMTAGEIVDLADDTNTGVSGAAAGSVLAVEGVNVGVVTDDGRAVIRFNQTYVTAV